jgi:very-short-patch-repair endonuclease
VAHRDGTVERVLARIATPAHGVVSRRELIGAGVTVHEIIHRVRTGALIREHPGVYRVGHRAASVEARYMAAVKACGEGAVVSGRAAGHLLGLVKGPTPPPEITAPKKRRVRGVRTRRSRRLETVQRANWRGIPVTTVAQTLVDLADVLDEDELARACHAAIARYGTTPVDVEAVLERWPRSPGSGKLRRVLRGDVRATLSPLERRFLRRLREAGLPLPETNLPAGGHWVDCRWSDERLTVELDSYRYHHSRHAWEQDRRRERAAYARGDGFRRYTYQDVFEDSTAMMAELRELLSASG